MLLKVLGSGIVIYPDRSLHLLSLLHKSKTGEVPNLSLPKLNCSACRTV